MHLSDRTEARSYSSAAARLYLQTPAAIICQLLLNAEALEVTTEAGVRRRQVEFSPRPLCVHCCGDHTPDKYGEMSSGALSRVRGRIASPCCFRGAKNLQRMATRL